MADHKPVPLILAFFLFFFSDVTLLTSHGQLLPIVDDLGGNHGGIQTYIVHVVKPKGTELLGDEELESWHRSFLPNTTLDSGASRLVYSYRHVISGFAARLTPEEAWAMEAENPYLRAQPDEIHQFQTTYTPEFLGLWQPFGGVWPDAMYGEGIIIGVVDSGIPLNHPSFDDTGMPPPPLRWKGSCNLTGSACNNKIIGAKGFFNGATASPIAKDGHGTHTASIAAGNFVDDADILGMAKGTASGMAPKAHLAIYKACFPGCADSDMYAAIDQAIKDGVDVLSLSLPSSDVKFYDNVVSKSTLAALKNGTIACAAAGNSGPDKNTLYQSAPWVLTVGASSTDRRIAATVKLGNKKEFYGEAAFQPYTFDSSLLLPLAYPGSSDQNATYCLKGSLDNFDVRGKVVMCWLGANSNTDKGDVVYAAGGAAVILMNTADVGATTSADIHVLPVSHVRSIDAERIQDYFYFSNSTPTATIIFNDTQFGYRPSPTVASFSSRGPSEMNGDIIKPDVLAPGVNILGAWPYELVPYPTGLSTKTFLFETGTSMATPHVSGIAALIKYRHPQWSPAAIQSAIITSAQELDLDGNIIQDDAYCDTADIYAMGAGQVNASGAMDPGLIYDRTFNDYIAYLCGLGYNDTEVSWTVGEWIQCSTINAISSSQLNYPSIAVSMNSTSGIKTIERTATNVGEANEVYQARIKEPNGVKVYLSTYQLRFTRLQQRKSFNVTLILQKSPGKGLVSRGKLEWVSKKHVVTSPIAVRFT